MLLVVICVSLSLNSKFAINILHAFCFSVKLCLICSRPVLTEISVHYAGGM